MKKKHSATFLFLSSLMILSLACQLSMDLPWNVGGEDGQISAEDVSQAATRAAVAAATAGVLTDQAGDIAGTAVSQGAEAVATAQIIPTAPPNINAGSTSLEQKLANIQPDADGNFTLSITESDLNEFISGQSEGQIQTQGFSAENIQIDISSESVELIGDVQEPLAVPLTVEMRPTVLDGKLQFEIISATAGIFPAPDSMLQLIEVTANSELTQALAGLPQNTTLQSVQLGEDAINISGRQE